MSKLTDFSEVLPIHDIENGMIINGHGDLTVGFEIELPVAFSKFDNDYHDMQEALKGVIHRIGHGATIHFVGFYYKDLYKADFDSTTQYTYLENEKIYDGKEMFVDKTYLFITFSLDHEKTKKSKKSVKKFSLFNRPTKGMIDFAQKVDDHMITIETGLDSIPGIKSKRLDDKALIEVLYQYCSFEFDAEIKDDVPNLSPIQNENGLFKVGQHYVGILSLVQEGVRTYNYKIPKYTKFSAYENEIDLPDSIKKDFSFSFPLTLGLPIDHVYTWSCELLDNEKVAQKLRLESKLLSLPSAFGNELANSKFDEIKGRPGEGGYPSFAKLAADRGLTMANMSVHVMVRSNSKTQLATDIEHTKAAFSNMEDAKYIVENFETLNVYRNNIPGNASRNTRNLINYLESAIFYFPLERAYSTEKYGMRLVNRFGSPIKLNTWDGLINKHGVVLGGSGYGKSVLMNLLIDSKLREGYHVTVLDVGGSYWGSYRLHTEESNISTLYVDGAKKENLSFSPFADCKKKGDKWILKAASDEDGEGSDDQLNYLFSILLKAWKADKVKETTSEQAAILVGLIESFYEWLNKEENKGTFPDFDLFWDFTRIYEKDIIDPIYKEKGYFDFDSFRLVTTRFKKGERYGHVFNGKENVDIINTQYVVFDVESIQKDAYLLDIISTIFMEKVGDKFLRLPKSIRKFVINDEGNDFLQNETGEFIAGVFRKARKKNGQIIFGTQNVGFIENAPKNVRQSILGNIEIRILLGIDTEKRNEKEAVINNLQLTEKDVQLIDSLSTDRSLPYREFFIKLGSQPYVYRNQLSKKALAVYSTTAEEKEKLEKLYEQKGSMRSAIESLVND